MCGGWPKRLCPPLTATFAWSPTSRRSRVTPTSPWSRATWRMRAISRYWCAVIVADIEDRKNMGVVERGGGACFLCEALQAVAIGREGRGKNLDGDVAVEAGVAGAGDFAPFPSAARRERK